MDGGVDLYLGPEHTYGAGPAGDLGNQVYNSWWGGMNTWECCNWKSTEQFPFIGDNQHIIAGLFPIEFMAERPNYRARYFREQVTSAAMDDPDGPISIWIWPQGAFSPESWQAVEYAEGDSADDYLQVLRDFSEAFVSGD